MVSPSAESSVRTLACTRESFRPASVEWVRWLALNADLYRVQQALRTDRVLAPDYAEWEGWHRDGFVFCGAMVKNAVVSMAGVLKTPAAPWELVRVRTQLAHRREGYGASACTFATRYILDNRDEAICSAAADNVPMLELLHKLGYRERP